MGYVAVKGGSQAIDESLRRQLYERLRRGRVLDVADLTAGLRSLIDQVMSEGSLYSEDLAALAIKQAEGSPEEAVFLLRAFRSTLPRKYYTRPVDTSDMHVERRISSSFKDVPGGQILGASLDYAHRLIDFELTDETDADAAAWLSVFHATTPPSDPSLPPRLPKAIELLRRQGMMCDYADDDSTPGDITQKSISFPASRSERLQTLTRGQTGAVTALGYAALRGYGALLHPTVGELRVGWVPICVDDPFAAQPDCDDAYYTGSIKVTEVETLVPVTVAGSSGQNKLAFELGYGLTFGQNETKAIAMSLLDQCLERPDRRYPTQDEEYVLLHIDTIEATGFISHLKLPHYVTFSSELDSLRQTRTEKG